MFFKHDGFDSSLLVLKSALRSNIAAEVPWVLGQAWRLER
jgi:hypothetical protein